MVGKLRVHEAKIIDIRKSGQGDGKFYVVTIEYERRARKYDFLLYEDDYRTKNFLRFVNVSSIDELMGKTVRYIAAEDLKEPGVAKLWLLCDKERIQFYDVEARKIISRAKAKKMISNFVFSEF